MANKPKNKHIVTSTVVTPKEILFGWLVEIDRFQDLYHQISALLTSPAALPPTAYIGQCPLPQLITLHQAMEAKLETLLLDMEHWPHRSEAPPHRRLAAHTRHLRRLNQRAQSSLLLATASPV